jgi:glycolate dehydrogenase iron-sulfur subunit
MIKYPLLEKHVNNLDQCVTCAICQTVCPSFIMSGKELLSPRGRISIIRRLIKNDLSPLDISSDTFDFCLLCYACQTACPAGVETEYLFISARETIAREKGIAKSKKFIFNMLSDQKRVNLAVGVGSVAQNILGKKVVNKLSGGVSVPDLRVKPYLKEIKEVIDPPERIRARVGFLLGCMSNYVTEGPARDSLEILRRLGAQIIIPHDQVCCGAPAFNNGDFEAARELAITNLDIFREASVDYLVSPDATCGGAFKNEIPNILSSDPKYSAIAEEMARKTFDWATFIMEFLDPHFPETKAPPIDIVIHDSCHLSHVGRTQNSVHRLLKLLPGVNIVPLEESSICCGFGGSFSSIYPNEATRWQQRKIDNLMDSRASVAIASSPGCITALRGTLKTTSPDGIRILHPAEFIIERCSW